MLAELNHVCTDFIYDVGSNLVEIFLFGEREGGGGGRGVSGRIFQVFFLLQIVFVANDRMFWETNLQSNLLNIKIEEHKIIYTNRKSKSYNYCAEFYVNFILFNNLRWWFFFVQMLHFLRKCTCACVSMRRWT